MQGSLESGLSLEKFSPASLESSKVPGGTELRLVTEQGNADGPSAFSFKQLKNAGLEEIYELVSRGAPLNEEQARTLSNSKLPLLLALVNLTPYSRQRAVVQLIHYFPINELLENNSPIALANRIQTELNELGLIHESITISIDSWHGKTSFEIVLDAISQIQDATDQSIQFIGPSTEELKHIALINQCTFEEPEFVNRIFAELLMAGISHLEGGADLGVQCLAAEHSLKVNYTHNLLKAGLRNNVSKSYSDGIVSSQAFLKEIFHLRQLLVPSNQLFSWSPWSNWVLDSSLAPAESPLGLEILNSIILARLLLPEVDFIRAPLSLLGPRLTELALCSGANHMGYVATNSDTAARLGVPSREFLQNEVQAEYRFV